MKVLLYCPLNPITPRVYARVVQGIFGLEWTEPLEIVFGRHDGLPASRLEGYDDLIEKHNRARQLALCGGFDALLLVEADMIIPPDALKRLAAIDTDVAYGLYCSRHGEYQWLAFSEIGKNTGKSIDRNRRYCTEKMGQVIETQGVGMGCTLIHRNVLEALEFGRNGGAADDWYFSLDCISHGFRQHHDLGVVCGHILGAGSVLWPDVTAPEMHRVEAEEVVWDGGDDGF